MQKHCSVFSLYFLHIAILLIVSGIVSCGTERFLPSPPPSEPIIEPASEPVAPAKLPIEETNWLGWYTCDGAQGKTALLLTTQWDPKTHRMTGVFAFSEHPDNPGIDSGSFQLKGTYSSNDNSMKMLPTTWIDKPWGWNLVGMQGTYEREQNQIHGNITSPSGQTSSVCETFHLDRQ